MSDQLQAFLDQGTSFEGKVTFKGVVRIDGHLRGEAHAEGTLVVGRTGVLEANLTVHALVVEGRVTGQVVARDRVEIAPGGRVEGGIDTPRLLVSEGAEISARVRMGPFASAQQAAATQPERRSGGPTIEPPRPARTA